MATIVICSSASFYEHVNQVAAELRERGFEVVVPSSAEKMAKTGDYDVTKHKTWYDKPADFERKAALMHEHFDKVATGGITLVVNDEKKGVKGYIGPNALMEMGLAFHLQKPIYVLNNVDKDMPVYEEVIGMGSIILDGDITKLSKPA
jgi:nucleoside 2-deoxyribosyltransferase